MAQFEDKQYDEYGNEILPADYGDAIEGGIDILGYGEGDYTNKRLSLLERAMPKHESNWQIPETWMRGWDSLIDNTRTMRNQLINPGIIGRPIIDTYNQWWDERQSPQEPGQQVPAIEESLQTQDILDA
jgi:hypothetical protein